MSLIVMIAILFTLSMVSIVCAIVKPHTHRTSMLVIGLLSPFIVIGSAVWALVRINGEVVPCPPHLEGVEREIDARRVKMFGGHPKLSYVAQIWQVRYHQYLKQSAESIQDLVENRRAA